MIDQDIITVARNRPKASVMGNGSSRVRIIVQRILPDTEARALAKRAAKYSEISICVSGYEAKDSDLQFLAHFPTVHEFDLSNYQFDNFQQLDCVPAGLRRLGLNRTRSKKLSLNTVLRFKGLDSLFLEGHIREIECIAQLPKLRGLTLRSIKLESLETLLPLKRTLESLALKLGGTSNLSLLPSFQKLKDLEIWQVSGLSDVSAASELPALRRLFLQSLPHVKNLPKMERLKKLRHVVLQNMKGITDLSPLLKAKDLRYLGLVEMMHLDPEVLRPFVGHPTLEACFPGFGKRKFDIATNMLGLPVRPSAWSFED